MTRYMYLYRGPAPRSAETTPDQDAERAAAFGAWMAKLGPRLIDVGSPFGPGATVRGDGVEGTATGLIGYSVVESASISEAITLTEGLPFLAGGDDTCTVEIFEMRSM